jgi:Raf kinase inhibitor-like YbhB/YbcL family protein
MNAGKPILADAPRTTFYHWVLVDIPAGTTEIAAGADSSGPAVKPPGPTPHGLRGVNGFGGGTHGGYDGPCPPWSDQRLHHYHFTVYAFDVPHLGVAGNFNATQALAAMQGHVLAHGEAVVVYSLNPAVRQSLGVR